MAERPFEETEHDGSGELRLTPAGPAIGQTPPPDSRRTPPPDWRFAAPVEATDPSWVPPIGPAGAVPGAVPGAVLPPYEGPSGYVPAGTSPPGRRGGARTKTVAVIAAAAVVIGALGGAGAVEVANSSAGTSTPTVSTSAPVQVAGNSSPPAITQIVKAVSPAVVSITASDSYGNTDKGTGMIITPSGQVLTNNHVIAGAITITVALNGSTKQIPARLVGTDPNKDVALLQIKSVSGLPTVSFGNSSSLQVGDPVVTIGNALALGGSTSVTSGIVSALGRQITAGTSTGGGTETLSGMIQTDAAINPGISGGPLLNASGQVIGMDTAAAGATSNGTSAQNIGFAIPSNELLPLLSGLRSGGNGSQNTLGAGSSSSPTPVGPTGPGAYGYGNYGYPF